MPYGRFAIDSDSPQTLLYHSLSMADDKTFDLVKYDEIAVQVLGEPRARPRVLTAYTGACASAVIVIAFRKPPPDLATDP